jgi:adenosylcobinamide-GDP ribazoletransferase
VAQAGSAQAVVATLWAAAAGIVLIAMGRFEAGRVAVLFAVVLVTTALSGWRYVRRLGGVTGDFLGATEQLCELAAYAVLAWGR